VDANSRDADGKTPLALAASAKDDALVSLEIANVLLGRRDVEADPRDNHGRTPLSYAAERGAIALVRLLLERDDVDPQSRDDEGNTVLDWAGKGMVRGVAWLVMKRTGVETVRWDRLSGEGFDMRLSSLTKCNCEIECTCHKLGC